MCGLYVGHVAGRVARAGELCVSGKEGCLAHLRPQHQAQAGQLLGLCVEDDRGLDRLAAVEVVKPRGDASAARHRAAVFTHRHIHELAQMAGKDVGAAVRVVVLKLYIDRLEGLLHGEQVLGGDVDALVVIVAGLEDHALALHVVGAVLGAHLGAATTLDPGSRRGKAFALADSDDAGLDGFLVDALGAAYEASGCINV